MSSFNLDIPTSFNTVDVSIIDTTAIITGPLKVFLSPQVGRHTTLKACCFSFLIENPRLGKKIVFDLGVRKDFFDTAPPALAKRVKESLGFDVTVEKSVAEILEKGGVDLREIDAVVWSHAHWDHMGEAAAFPRSTDLIVGPDVPKHFFPGYPSDQGAAVSEADHEGRKVQEIRFDEREQTIQVGGMAAHDYFGDGSLYFLNSPGHAIGHICALARTTPTTFILMAADTAHHGGQFRPSAQLPLSPTIDVSALHLGHEVPTICPGHFESLHPEQGNPTTEPFYRITVNPDGSTVAHDLAQARDSIQKLIAFDACEDVYVVIAHDRSLLSHGSRLELFPKTANHWKRAGWKEDGLWRFLASF